MKRFHPHTDLTEFPLTAPNHGIQRATRISAFRIRTLACQLALLSLLILPLQLGRSPFSGNSILSDSVTAVSHNKTTDPQDNSSDVLEAETDSTDREQAAQPNESPTDNKANRSGSNLDSMLSGFLPKSPKQADAISQFAKTSELLGPLTPLAMSPFFGITILCGMTQLPEGWAFADWLSNNYLLGTNPVLNHPATFWIFLLLTIITSVPRFTKVTKPIAQALDWVESYAGLITSLVILGLGLIIVESAESSPTIEQVAEAGILAWTLNAFLLVAATVNFLVVKSVRFLFEMLIWISPIPFVDACFEITNKAICLALLMLYATSPTLAFFVNVLVFVVCLFVMNWAKRRVDYHWHIWLAPFIQWIYPAYGKFDGKNLWVYCEQDFAPFKKYDCVHLYKWDDQWYLMRYDWFWRKTFRTFSPDDLPMLEVGKTRNALVLQQQVPVRFAFHRGYTKCLDEIAKGLDISTKERVDFRAQRAIDQADGKLGEA